MKSKKCIMVLYTKGLYDKPAIAIKEYIQKVYQDCCVVAIDDESYQKGWQARLIKRSYVACIRNAAWVYNAYSFMAERTSLKRARKNAKAESNEKHIKGTLKDVSRLAEIEAEREVSSMLAKGEVAKHKNQSESKEVEAKLVDEKKKPKPKLMCNAMVRYEPEIVICLTPKALRVALKARQATESKCKVFAFCTDYCVDKRFVKSECDGYFVQNEQCLAELAACNVNREKIKIVSLPLPRESFKQYNKQAVQENYKIVNKEFPTYLICGGRYGAGYTKKVFDLLSPFSDKINIVVTTGTSASLSKYLSVAGKTIEKSQNIYIVEKVENFSSLYAIADIVFCSPTTATTFEILSRGIPCLLLPPTGELEKGNYKFLTEAELCLPAVNKTSTENALEKTAELDLLVLKKRMRAFAESDCVIPFGDWLYDKAIEIRKQKDIKDDDEDSIEEIETQLDEQALKSEEEAEEKIENSDIYTKKPDTNGSSDLVEERIDAEQVDEKVKTEKNVDNIEKD